MMENPKTQFEIKLLNFKVIEINYHNNSLDNSNIDELSVNVGYGIGFNANENNQYSVSFDVELKNEEKDFSIKCKTIAFFQSKHEIDDEFKKSPFIQINSPAIAFPFLRSFISTLTTNAGINPIILPALNFTKLK